MITVTQYLIYLLIGAWLFLFISIVGFFYIPTEGTKMLLGLMVVFSPLFLCGYASALSLFYPRIAALMATIFVSPFLYVVITSLFSDSFKQNAFLFAPPATIILISTIVLFLPKDSSLLLQKQQKNQVEYRILAIVPVLLATSLLIVGSYLFYQRAALQKIASKSSLTTAERQNTTSESKNTASER